MYANMSSAAHTYCSRTHRRLRNRIPFPLSFSLKINGVKLYFPFPVRNQKKKNGYFIGARGRYRTSNAVLIGYAFLLSTHHRLPTFCFAWKVWSNRKMQDNRRQQWMVLCGKNETPRETIFSVVRGKKDLNSFQKRWHTKTWKLQYPTSIIEKKNPLLYWSTTWIPTRVLDSGMIKRVGDQIDHRVPALAYLVNPHYLTYLSL